MSSVSQIRIQRLSRAEDLAALRAAWSALVDDVPFRGFAWLEGWWQSYGGEPRSELCTLAAFDGAGELLGLAPWYLAQSGPRRVIRCLGSGEVCSDYMTILCREGREREVTRAMADWLCEKTSGESAEHPEWDLLELDGVNESDRAVNGLIERLAELGHPVDRRSRTSCWRVSLPGDWESYLAMLSKSHRKQIRRLERTYVDSHRARVRIVATEQELEEGLEILSRLHQRRWESLGQRGCFSSPRFAAFQYHTARQLLRLGQLRLSLLELDGRTVAAEYQLLGGDVVYAYQSGMEPDSLRQEPGRLILAASLRLAIAEGRRAFDFLRGDELYKAHWRARPRAMQNIRVAADRPGARLRHNLWVAGANVKRWISDSLKTTGTVSY